MLHKLLQLKEEITGYISKPGTGIGGSLGAFLLSFIESSTPILRWFGMAIGLLIGIATLYLKWVEIADKIKAKHIKISEETQAKARDSPEKQNHRQP